MLLMVHVCVLCCVLDVHTGTHPLRLHSVLRTITVFVLVSTHFGVHLPSSVYRATVATVATVVTVYVPVQLSQSLIVTANPAPMLSMLGMTVPWSMPRLGSKGTQHCHRIRTARPVHRAMTWGSSCKTESGFPLKEGQDT